MYNLHLNCPSHLRYLASPSQLYLCKGRCSCTLLIGALKGPVLELATVEASERRRTLWCLTANTH